MRPGTARQEETDPAKVAAAGTSMDSVITTAQRIMMTPEDVNTDKQ
jgi:hypothetical protein